METEQRPGAWMMVEFVWWGDLYRAFFRYKDGEPWCDCVARALFGVKDSRADEWEFAEWELAVWHGELMEATIAAWVDSVYAGADDMERACYDEAVRAGRVLPADALPVSVRQTLEKIGGKIDE